MDGRTVIANLHTLDTARRYCDRVIGMRDGRIVFDGLPEQLTTGAGAEKRRAMARRFPPSAPCQSGFFSHLPITPMIPSRNSSTPSTKITPCSTVTQAPKLAK